MAEIRVKLDTERHAGPFFVATGVENTIIVQRPRFEVELLDDLNSPMAGVMCRVEFSDGRVVKKRSDAQGLFSALHDLGESLASFTLPEQDGSTWEVDPKNSDAGDGGNEDK